MIEDIPLALLTSWDDFFQQLGFICCINNQSIMEMEEDLWGTQISKYLSGSLISICLGECLAETKGDALKRWSAFVMELCKFNSTRHHLEFDVPFPIWWAEQNEHCLSQLVSCVYISEKLRGRKPNCHTKEMCPSFIALGEKIPKIAFCSHWRIDQETKGKKSKYGTFETIHLFMHLNIYMPLSQLVMSLQ